MQYRPHDYQRRAEDLILQRPHVGLFLEMGLGKTVITLSALFTLILDRFEARKALVIAPKRVAEDTWTREAQKWDHLRGLVVRLVSGTPAQRAKALDEDADVYVIGRDNVVWLDEHYKGREFDFDAVVIDELSSFKNPRSKRFKALRRLIAGTPRVIGLTGTPSPNGLMDLWAEIYLLDRGKRLGRTLTAYRETYFRPGDRNGAIVYNWKPKRGAQEAIEEKLSDICVSMTAADYLNLPERIDNMVNVTLSQKALKAYREMEEEQVLTLCDDAIAATTAATAIQKLMQIANGNVYTAAGGVEHIHDDKLDTLEEILDATDEPVLVYYSFGHDLEAIRGRFGAARTLDGPEDIRDWNEGRIRLLLAHPASVGYGINIQDGGRIIVWYGLTYSLELYQQANARLYRQGQQKPVIIHHLIATGTIDEDILAALERKDTSQASLINALRDRRPHGREDG